MSRQQKYTLVTLLLGVFMAALDLSIVSPAFQTLENYFHVEARYMSWLVTGYVLTNIVANLVMAYLSDRFGRRPIYMLAVALFGVGSVVAALSPVFGLFLAGRAIQAAGAGGLFPIAAAVIGDSFPRERRGMALGLIGALWAVAAIIGPNLGGWIIESVGWQGVFWVNIPVCAAVLALAVAVLPGGSRMRGVVEKFDLAGALLLGGMLVAVMLTVTEAGDGGISWQEVAFGTSSVALLLAFVWVERRAAHPVISFDLMRSRQILLANLLSFVAGFSEAGLFFLPTLAMATLTMSAAEGGRMVTPIALALLFATPVAGTLVDKRGSRLVITIGLLLSGLAYMLLGLLPGNVFIFVGLLLLGGVGLACLLGSPLRYIITNAAPAERRASGLALFGLFTNVGIAIGSTVGGVLLSVHGEAGRAASIHSVYVVTGVVVLLGLLLAAMLKNRAQEAESHALEAATDKTPSHNHLSGIPADRAVSQT